MDNAAILKVVKQYLDGGITFMEMLDVLTKDYLEKQRRNEAQCLTCGSDLSKRLV